MPELASWLSRVPPAATLAMGAKVRAMRAQGIAVISLAIGEPDFSTPPHAIEAAYQFALKGATGYPPVDGLPTLKAAIQRKFARENGLDYALDEIMVANGGKQVIFDALFATLEPGDEVVIPVPAWAAYELTVRALGGVPVLVPCSQEDGFRLRPEALEAAITPRSKWLFLNYPNNPSGAACDAAGLAAIGAVVERHPQLWVLSDEMYEHLLYDGMERASIAAVCPAIRDRVLTMNGVSKTYAMTGWRIGYAGGPKVLIKAMANAQGQISLGASAPAQAAAAAALDGKQDFLAAHVQAYQRRRDIVATALADAPGMRCHVPEGAFYLFPDITACLGKTTKGGRLLLTDEDFAAALLEEEHVAVVHGAAFGMAGHLRISYALIEASAKIVSFCRGLH